MSERGSFVTEYIYCEKCFEKMKNVLVKNEKYLKGIVIPSWEGKGKELPIIAGKIGGLAPSEELLDIQLNIFNSENAPCHIVRIAVLADSGEGNIFNIYPDGHVSPLDEIIKKA